MATRQLLADVRTLISHSMIYGLGSVWLKAIGFFLIPLYTRFLTKDDYGILAVATATASVLGILYTLSLRGAVLRFYFMVKNEGERRQINGTIWVMMVLTALTITLLLDRLGGVIFTWLFREVPFVPYIRLVIWTSFFTSFSELPLAMFRAQERPVPYVLATAANSLVTVGLVISLVVFRGMGAHGYLLGSFLARAFLAVPYIILALRFTKVTVRWDILRAVLAFSLPLVPHSLFGWVLELSDRIILERFVPLEQLGLYSLGYQFGSAILMLTTAINFVWSPFLYKTVSEEGEAANQRLARLVTYYTLLLCFVALGWALFAKEIIVLLASPAFHASYQVVPWIVGGQLLNGLYYIPVSFLFLEKKTKLVPLVTVSSGILNVGLNFWLAPRFGIMAAAWATLLGYAVMLVLVWRIALHIHSFPYEYKRLRQIILVTLALYAGGNLSEISPLILGLVVKGGLLLAFPLLLLALDFFTPAEKKTAFSAIQHAGRVVNRIRASI